MSIAIDLVTHFQWPGNINDLQIPICYHPCYRHHLQSDISRSFNMRSIFVQCQSDTDSKQLAIRPSLFCISHSVRWSGLNVQTAHRNTATTKQIRILQSFNKKKKVKYKRQTVKLSSHSAAISQISPDIFTSSTLVIISSCA